jgi:glutathione S-transferase
MRARAALEASPPALGRTPHVGHIALVRALGYRDLRFAGSWRKDHPRVAARLEDLAGQVLAFEQTKVAAVLAPLAQNR